MSDEQKETWDFEYKSSKNKWKKESLNMAHVMGKKKVLELGVGNGKTLISILKQKPSKVIAIDFSKEAIKYCKDNFNYDNVEFVCGDIINMPFKNKEFDVVVCYYVLNNLTNDERKNAVYDIQRVLKNNGVVLFEDFYVGDMRHEEKDKDKELGERNTIVKDNGIICHFFEKEEVMNLFGEFKLKKIQIDKRNPIRKNKNIIRKTINCMFEKP